MKLYRFGFGCRDLGSLWTIFRRKGFGIIASKDLLRGEPKATQRIPLLPIESPSG